MNRNEFLKNASAATVLAYFGISLESCSIDVDEVPSGGVQKSVELNINHVAYIPLENYGGWVLHPSENILIVNDEGDLKAFGSRCTHSGCTRDWDTSNEIFHCSCHGSKFNFDGEVVTGPANAPLTQLTLTRNGDIVTIG